MIFYFAFVIFSVAISGVYSSLRRGILNGNVWVCVCVCVCVNVFVCMYSRNTKDVIKLSQEGMEKVSKQSKFASPKNKTCIKHVYQYANI